MNHRLTRALAGRSPLLEDPHGMLDARDGLFAFARLGWVLRAVRAGWLDRVLTPSPASAATLMEHGVAADYVPVGYHPSMGHDRGGRRDLDLVFLRAAHGVRSPRLARIGTALARAGTTLTVVDADCSARPG